MAGRDHRRNLSSSSGRPERRRSATPSPAWSQQLPVGMGSGRAKSLFRSIGVWFSSLSTPSSLTSASSKKTKRSKPPAALPSVPEDAIKKPPSFGHGSGRPSLLRGGAGGGGLYSNGSRRGSVAAQQYQFQSSVFPVVVVLLLDGTQIMEGEEKGKEEQEGVGPKVQLRAF